MSLLRLPLSSILCTLQLLLKVLLLATSVLSLAPLALRLTPSLTFFLHMLGDGFLKHLQQQTLVKHSWTTSSSSWMHLELVKAHIKFNSKHRMFRWLTRLIQLLTLTLFSLHILNVLNIGPLTLLN